MINLGGTKAGEISTSTLGHPGRYTYCIGEHEEASPWEPLHVERGFAPEESTVTVFSGEGPFIVNDHLSRSAPQLLASLGWSAAGLWNHKSFPLYGPTLWVIGPEHPKTIGAGGWSKARVKRNLYDTILRPGRERHAAVLAQSLGPERVARRRGVHLLDGERRHVFRPRDRVVHQCAG